MTIASNFGKIVCIMFENEQKSKIHKGHTFFVLDMAPQSSQQSSIIMQKKNSADRSTSFQQQSTKSITTW